MGAMVGDPPLDTPVDSMTFLREFQNSLQGLDLRVISGSLRSIIPRASWDASCAVAHQYIEHFIDQAQSRHQSAPDNAASDIDSSHHQSLLDDLVNQTEKREKIRNHLIQGMMTAQDTSSILIANAIFLLSRSPIIWSRVRLEAKSLDTANITFDSLRSSKLLQNILHESKSISWWFVLIFETCSC